MKMSVTVIGVVGIATAASGQTFLQYIMSGVNLTDAGRGITAPQRGDVLRLSVIVNHDGAGYAGGKLEILYTGVADGSIDLTEDAFAFPFEPWEVGRTPITRIVASDGNTSATLPHNVDVVAAGGKITDVNDDFFDFASTPPGLGGLGVAFPTADGDAAFVFDYIYRGGFDIWDVGHNGSARLWRDSGDINGVVVEASSGVSLWVAPPTPATIAPLVMMGVIQCQRRR